MKPDDPRAIKLSDYTPSAILIERVDLVIQLDPTRTRVDANLKLRRNPRNLDATDEVILDGEHLELASVAVNGTVLSTSEYHLDDEKLVLPLAGDGPFDIALTTFVSPETNTALQGIYRSRGIYCSQCEAQGFRRITYFIDRPDVLAIYTVRLEADRSSVPILLANGNPMERGTLSGGRHYAVWHDPHPKPSYLFAIVGGDLGSIASTFRTRSGRSVDLRIYVEHGKESRAHWAMDALKRSFAWDEAKFGREYDLDVFNLVGVSDFNMGAMENKGLNIFNDRLVLASAETATDANYEAIESVVAHEYFHNWTGNRITCRDWFQLCLKEGLTVYRDQEFSADERSRTVQRISDVRQLKALQFPEDQGPLAHPVRPDSYIEINNFYTATVYEKGAELVRMIETILGPDLFRAGMDLYFDRHDGDAATIEDFIACFADASGQDFAQFTRWYTQAGTPWVVCDFQYDKASSSAQLTMIQSQRPTAGQAKKDPLYIPVRYALLGENGHAVDAKLTDGEEVRPGVLALTDFKQTFRFTGLTSRPVPSLFGHFSAPVTVTLDLSDNDLSFLMRHDPDLFNRWQAANTFATRRMLGRLNGRPDAGDIAAYAAAVRAAIHDDALDDAYKVELLRLPTASDLAREKASDVDPAAIDAAQRSFARDLAAELKAELQALYQNLVPSGAFSPDAKSAGQRALRNGALTLLTLADTDENAGLLEQHYRAAGNMTDAAHALNLICHKSGPRRDSVLAHFAETWQHDHLVIDMWFAAQAQSQRADTLDAVRGLMGHPLFKITTPNKVRALIGIFAMSNPLQFNRPDGAGYRFVADTIVEVDRINPQIAARLLGAFRSSPSLVAPLRDAARQALKSVASGDGLSRDCQEMAVRLLDS